ncbi:MAG: hypothetical protein M1491_07245 [Deltaproteobacteria bacterium]|nr:hypothetical protein [Deltaproteobacteria bacterium]MCL5276533.1 hypothetical protein [Deltaproteobacteria bacterium]
MKRVFISVLVLSSTVLLAGGTYAMGLLQGEAGYIPMTKTNRSFTIIDQLGTSTAVEHGSIDGKDYLWGYSGMILNMIPFDNIVSISFTNESGTSHVPAELLNKLDNEPLSAAVRLKDGTVVNITVDGSLRCYGRTTYGYVRAKLSSLYAIEGVKQIKRVPHK